ncbi:hypothetical protein B7P43_G10653 [Cryptotermes secundus]|uniref:SMB domain-containing protein n=1 Tax=Cryptotermes secundus TaxID=105785 RepID=A0A2J7QBD9_9NEOP|nr:hypothetical protein B7P43_G10653 [Cryptotermes secundus]
MSRNLKALQQDMRLVEDGARHGCLTDVTTVRSFLDNGTVHAVLYTFLPAFKSSAKPTEGTLSAWGTTADLWEYGFGVLITVIMKSFVFSGITPCCPLTFKGLRVVMPREDIILRRIQTISELPMPTKFQMQSRNMAAGAVTILLALLIHRAEADEFTLADALQSNGSRCGENGKLYPSEFSVPEMYWQAFGAPCSCDPLCAPYKDCCQNSEHFAAEDQVWGSSPQSCFNVSERDPYFSMKKSCPASWDDDETRSKCQGHPDFPLTSSWTLVTYLNMYCAECNRDFHPDTDTLWPAEYRCHGDGAFRYEVRVDSGENDTTDVNISTWNLTHSDNFHYRYPVNAFVFLHSYFVPEDLTLYDPRSRPNFLKTEDENPPKEHNKHTRVHPGDYRCDRFFSVLNRSIMRICPQVISTCASDWTESDVEGKCLAYTDIYCNKKYLYRNPYCAHCNRVNLKHKFSCFLMESASSRANFSWLQKWNSNKYDVFPLENHTSIQDADEGQTELYPELHLSFRPLCVGGLPRVAPGDFLRHSAAKEPSGHEPCFALRGPVAFLLYLTGEDSTRRNSARGARYRDALQPARHLLLDARHILRRVECHQEVDKEASVIFSACVVCVQVAELTSRPVYLCALLLQEEGLERTDQEENPVVTDHINYCRA